MVVYMQYLTLLDFAMQEDYGIDWSGPLPSDTDADTVTVPTTECPLSTQQLETLKQTLDPFEECTDYGVQLYTATRLFVNGICSNSDLGE